MVEIGTFFSKIITVMYKTKTFWKFSFSWQLLFLVLTLKEVRLILEISITENVKYLGDVSIN